MQLHGQQIIGSETSAQNTATFAGVNPAAGQDLEPQFHEATPQEVDRAVTLADQAFNEYRRTSPETKAKLLEAIADQVMELGDALLERANAETGLPMGRVTGERGRAVSRHSRTRSRHPRRHLRRCPPVRR